MKAKCFNYYTVVLISGKENQERCSWYKNIKTGSEHNSLAGKDKTMEMNNEARQGNIIHIVWWWVGSDKGMIYWEKSYLFIGLGS